MNAQLPFYHNCVGWPRDDVHEPGGLCDMIDAARPITRKTFLKHVDRNDQRDLERMLGYAPHEPDSCLTMKRDWAVSYHRSELHEQRVYFFTQSAVEYVFAP